MLLPAALALVLACICQRAEGGREALELTDVLQSFSSPAHVTRLHRYDHSGLEAMLEAESRWHKGGHSALVQISGFVPISEKQAQALREHHLSHLQVSRSSSVIETAGSKRYRSIQYHDPATGAHAKAVTGLSNLESQYVGPIGVGSVLVPQDCAPGGSLVYISQRDKSDTHSKERVESCHVEDQAQVWVVFDTGSTNIWVDSDLCKKGACTRRPRKYDHTKSRSFSSPPTTVLISIQFGTGAITGPQGIDDFHVGPFTIYNQSFGMIETEEGFVFYEVPFEGILGLAFPSMSANGAVPFFDNIINQQALDKNIFSFYFSLADPAANAVFWGGVDPAFFTGPIEYFKVVDPFYWSVTLLAFKIGSHDLTEELRVSGPPGAGNKTIKAIVDTGTTYFSAGSKVFQHILSLLPSVPCSQMTPQSHPPVTLTLLREDGKPRDFVLDNSQYMTSVGGNVSAGSLCSPAFMSIEIPVTHAPAMVLGEVFLRNYYSVFDRGDGSESQGRVGFALARHDQEAVARLKTLTQHQPAFQEVPAA